MYRYALAFLVVATACGNDAPADGAPAEADRPEVAEAPAEGPAAKPAPEPEPEPEPVVPAARPTEAEAFEGHHVLVRNGATLRMGDGPDAPELTLSLPDADADPPPTRAMRVIGHEGGRLLVRSPAAKERCGEGLAALRTFDVTFSIAPSAASRVLARPFEAKFRDGTRVTLRPGVAVGDEAKAVAVDAGGIHLALEIPETEIYDPDPNEAPPAQAQTLALGKRLSVDGAPISPQSALYDVGQGRPALLATSDVGDTTFSRVGNRCATFEAKTSDGDDATEEERVAAMARSAGIIGVLGSTGMDETYSVEPGTQIYWPDGSEAGEVLASHTFDKYQAEKGGKGSKGKRCFSEALDPSLSGGSMILCFARKDVTVHESPYAALLGTSIGGGGFGSGATLGTLGTGTEDIWGGLTGEEFGVGGLGSSGSGRGGGGTGEGTIGGLGGLGTKGIGGGESGYGAGGKSSSTKPKVTISTTVTGDLSKEFFAKTVQRMKTQLRYCYERELTSDPTLSGTVTVSVTIGSSGTVSATSSSGPEDVAACMEKVVKRFVFPSASGISVGKLTAKLSTT